MQKLSHINDDFDKIAPPNILNLKSKVKQVPRIQLLHWAFFLEHTWLILSTFSIGACIYLLVIDSHIGIYIGF